MVAVVVIAWDQTEYAGLAFGDGRSPLDHLETRLSRITAWLDANGDLAGVWRAAPSSFDGHLPADGVLSQASLVPIGGDGAETIHAIAAALPEHCEHLVVTGIDTPFVDPLMTAYLFELHRRSWSDYTFADGYPTGFAPEIVRRDALPAIAALAAANRLPANRSLLFEALSRDINAFDVETEAASDDLAALRLPLTVDTRSAYLYCRTLVDRGAANDIPAIGDPPDPYGQRFPDDTHRLLSVVSAEPASRRTVPSYIQVQITERFAQRATYTPWALERYTATDGEEMSLDLWRNLLAQAAELSPEAILSIGYRGEPARHSDLAALIAAVAGFPKLRLYIETCGLGWGETMRTAAASAHVAALIVELDAADEKTYRTLRGEGFHEAREFVVTMAQRMPGRVYAQATRLRDNEWELQQFYRHWKDVDGVSPLIQKFNSYLGRVEDRSVANLAPLERNPCWHLQRDLVVLVDGTVVRCGQDIDRDAVRGRLPHDSLVNLWNAGESDYLSHTRGDFPAPCRTCDEFYTFNA